MSTQTISGRHRSVRTRERWLRLRRASRAALRNGEQLLKRLAPSPRPFKAGAAYLAELLTPAPPREVRTLHVGRATIGYYAPTYVAAAPHIHDEVRVNHYPVADPIGQTGIVVEIVGTVRPVVVEVPGLGRIFCDSDWLELTDRVTERTLTMAPVLADAGAERAW